MTQKRSVFFLMQHFISQNIKVVKPISKPKKDLQKEFQSVLLLVKQGHRAVAASDMRFRKI